LGDNEIRSEEEGVRSSEGKEEEKAEK